MNVFQNRQMHLIFGWILLSLCVLLVLLAVLVYCFTYWDLDCTSLRQRKLWKEQKITWQEVTRVGRLGFGANVVKISYGHSVEDYGWLLAAPRNRGDFIDTLRRYAPHAEFDL